ncbi:MULTISPECIES: ABC transporter ATP-binding protein [Paenibacillus]|uniref:ABC transporter ATP-binding protein n=2 Tax=Paenibacillus TaxID=44249 RepID=A0AAJ2K0A2_9BACL|nr:MULTISPECIES: ABC transporter ATP-binding protein [Paenibacillus]MDT8979637.1 ABC transporter ATP-binding protein [Paenibacillus sp. chi10]TQR42138.1 ABC transporter ATP-binding protein [Paenibacillus sp. SDF0028]GAV14415.1 ABC-type transporter ATP-binding protein EcsA [Paenibacillus sp. NAIST15-1]
MKPLLKIDRLTGGYSTGRPVLHDISLQVNAGEMVGLIGLNGAGKSTTMKHILGLLEPQAGSVAIHGKTLAEDAEAYRAAIAYVPESPILYDALTVREHLVWTATAYGVEQGVFEKRVRELAEMFHMTAHLDKAAQHLSKGMRQKTMLMCAFAVRPPLYIIDEPFLGLDPLGIRSLLQYMKQVQAEGASLLVSSHILSTIEHYCDSFVLLHHGKVLGAGTVHGMHDQYEAQSGKRAEERLEELFYAWVSDERITGSVDGVQR